jgi:hypothetical protein
MNGQHIKAMIVTGLQFLAIFAEILFTKPIEKEKEETHDKAGDPGND